jgi:hypothetical protein
MTARRQGPRFAEEHDGVLVDVALATMLRHHTETPDEFRDALAFFGHPATRIQMDVLLRHIGRRLPLAVDEVVVERRASGRILRCEMRFDLHTRWVNGELRLPLDRAPMTMMSACFGRPLRSILDHPYVPDLLVMDMDAEDRWIIHPKERTPAP